MTPGPVLHRRRRRFLLMGVLLGGLVVLGRGAQLQLLESGRWLARAEAQQREQLELAAPRGTLYDRDGVPLAASQEAYRVAVAPRELEDAEAAARRLREVLGLGEAEARRVVSPVRRWVVLAGRYDATVRERLEGLRGVYLERVVERFYPRGELGIEVLGRVSADGTALGGMELELDSILAGEPGLAVVRRDARGEPIPGTMMVVREPVPGLDVHLTLDAELQEIAEEAVRAAVERTGAEGGDLLLVDPRTGEVLAAASRRVQPARSWRGTTEPYEPGSTIKPLIVAALLAEGKATLADSVHAEDGRYVEGGRTITDVHGYGWLTLRDALRVSSNIAMVKMAARLTPEEEYGYLRDFGFGTPTGIRYPSESAGLLRRPAGWSRYSGASLTIGYEVSVTPLQMALAYGALANGGVLLEPRIVREVRARDGRVVHREAPRAVRRVIPEAQAAELRGALVEVVEGGSGHEASLGPFQVAGKTGTARAVRGGRYESGAYTASFAGFFPAQDPQLVFLVKLDRPRGAYYGGLAAAPVSRATLEAALAAWNTPLDRGAVAAAVAGREADAVVERAEAGPEVVTVVEPPPAARAALLPAPGPFIFALEAGPPRRVAEPGPARTELVPEVVGLPVRDAVRELHRAGFRVRSVGSGVVGATEPAGGVVAAAGSVVELRARGEDR